MSPPLHHDNVKRRTEGVSTQKAKLECSALTDRSKNKHRTEGVKDKDYMCTVEREMRG